MIVFAAACVLLVALALAFVLPPLLHPEGVAAVSSPADANVAIYRRQLAEMESEHRLLMVTDDQFRRERDELEHRLVVDLPEESRATSREPSRSGGSSGLVYAIAVGLPLTALLTYLALGAPSSILTPP